MTIFKCQMVYIFANMNRFRHFFFHDEDPKAAPSTVHFTVFWYYGEVQENYSSNKVAKEKILTVNQNCTPIYLFLVCLFVFFLFIEF